MSLLLFPTPSFTFPTSLWQDNFILINITSAAAAPSSCLISHFFPSLWWYHKHSPTVSSKFEAHGCWRHWASLSRSHFKLVASDVAKNTIFTMNGKGSINHFVTYSPKYILYLNYLLKLLGLLSFIALVQKIELSRPEKSPLSKDTCFKCLIAKHLVFSGSFAD